MFFKPKAELRNGLLELRVSVRALQNRPRQDRKGANAHTASSAVGSAPRRRETPVEEDSTRIIVDRSGS